MQACESRSLKRQFYLYLQILKGGHFISQGAENKDELCNVVKREPFSLEKTHDSPE